MYRDQFRKFKESPQRDMQPTVDVQDVDGVAGAPEAGVDDMRPSDRHGDYGENIMPQPIEQSNMYRSSKPSKNQPDVGSGLVDRDSVQVNDDLKHTVTPPNAIHEQPGEKRRVMIMQEDDSAPKKKKERPMTAEEKALKKKISEINSTTRWLADSAFTTYFGKPAFHAYGKGNTRPTNTV